MCTRNSVEIHTWKEIHGATMEEVAEWPVKGGEGDIHR